MEPHDHSSTTLLESLLPSAMYAAVQPPDCSLLALNKAQIHLTNTLATLEPFAPLLARTAQRDPTSSVTLPAHYLSGTLLCADLSGFTVLTSQLAAIGRQGSEEVSAIINQMFNRLLGAVYDGGGEVVKFAGDAITAFFAAEQMGADHAALAADAAIQMQTAMRDFAMVATSRGAFRLRVRITVHSGSVFLAEVGDEQHRELIVTGRAVNHVILAQRYAAAGEIVITPATKALLPDAETSARFPDLFLLHTMPERPALPPKPLSPTQPPTWAGLAALAERIQALQAYVPIGLTQRLVQITHAEGEFRPVSVIFTRISAISNALALLDGQDVTQREITTVQHVLNMCYIRVQAALGYFGGRINKVDMGADGDRLMAIFGAPIAHEDDPERAVKAALELCTVLREIDRDTATFLQTWRDIHDLQFKKPSPATLPPIGLASGIVFAGIVGTLQRHEYTVMGEIVNLAARLFEVARPGDVVLPIATYQVVQHVVAAEPLPPLRLKGFAEQISAFQVQHLLTVASYTSHTPFVGRNTELNSIVTRIETALQHGNQAGVVVAVAGEAGIGKTRLGEEALRRIEAPRIVRIVCQSYEQTTPYAAIGRVLREVLRLNPAQNHAAQAAATEQRMRELVPEWSSFAPLLDPIINVRFVESALTRLLSPAQRRERTDDLIVLLLLAAARREPTVLLVDTLEWIDASSSAMLERLAAELSGVPLALLLTYRPMPTLNEPWRDLAHCLTVPIAPLNYAESSGLITALLGGTPPPELAAVIERTAGTPLYLEQTALYLLESKAIARDEAGVIRVVNPATIQNIPSQIEQIIVARLDTLDEETRSLLQVAAVIGQEFTEQTLAAVVPPHVSRQRRLRDLVRAEILQVDPSAATTTYRFHQALIRDVAYDSLLYVRRQTLHAAVAGAIEALYTEQPDEQRMKLAYHHAAAAQPQPALRHYLFAARQAQNRYANQEALVLYEQALTVADLLAEQNQLSDDDALLVYTNAGDVLATTGQYNRARGLYKHLLDTMDDLHMFQQATLQRKIGSTYEQQGDWEAALDWFATAEAHVADAEPDLDVMREYAQILSAVGWIYFRQGNLEAARYNLNQALDIIRPLGIATDEASILNRLGGVAWQSGDIEQARTYVEQSLQASQQAGDLIAQASALNNLGNLTASQERTAESIRFYQHALALQEQTGSRHMMASTANNLGWALYDAERYDDARQALDKALNVALELRDVYTQSIALSNLGLVMIEINNLEAATSYLERSQTLANQADSALQIIENTIAFARIALKRNNLDQAATLYQQAVDRVSDKESEEYAKLQRLEAQLLWKRGMINQAKQLLSANYNFFIRLHNIAEARRTERLLNQIK